MISLGVNQMNNSIIENPTPGTYSTAWQEKFFNSSTAVVTFSLYKEVNFIQWGDSNGFTFLYGLYNAGNNKLTAYSALAAESTQLAACTTWNCPTTQYSYTVNLVTGKPSPVTPFKVSNPYPTSQRPWFWPVTANNGVSYTLYFSTFTNAHVLAISQPYYQRYVNSGFTEYKAAANYVVLDYLSAAIARLNSGSVSTTGYIMTTMNPVGLLVATSTGIKTNMTTYAVSSPNAIISSTAQYIAAQNIQEDTAGYVESLGCYLNVAFFTYGATNPALVSPPTGSNLPSASTAGMYVSIRGVLCLKTAIYGCFSMYKQL